MSDSIKHECGIALVRLLKPLEYYIAKYGTPLYGLNKMYLLMEKQHNRGQDGAGVANIKFDMEPGNRYISRLRSNSNKPIPDIFDKINGYFAEVYKQHPDRLKDVNWLKQNVPFTGELTLGHLRYGTYGKNSIENCHPFLRQNNWMTKNLVLAGNFNLTNVDELFNHLLELGQHPKEKADTVTVLEKIGHFLDKENERLFKEFKNKKMSNEVISIMIGKNLDIKEILARSTKKFDGGYVIAGLLGHGDSFVMRDPNGIRPAHWYADEEVVVVASERPAIQTAFNVKYEDVKEITPGSALIIKRDGKYGEQQVLEQKEKTSCSFERIYFSRGSDKDIYEERKNLGKLLADQVLEAVNYDFDNTVFSFVPNTAEVCFYGMVKGMDNYLRAEIKKTLTGLGNTITPEEIDNLLTKRVRIEKVAIKDAKLRTFITDDTHRDDLVTHVYDVTYGSVRPTDTLVIIDDSIVRGTTLKKSIFRMLDRLNPKKIIVVSSAPQIRYPDCYGIDMAKLGDFIAFQSAIALLKDTKQEAVINDVYKLCKDQQDLPSEQLENHVKKIYAPFTDEQISVKMAELLRPSDIKAETQMIFQTIDNLHKAIPGHTGDWYFSGNFPTPGGNKVVNTSFINFIEGKNQRAY
jgi:amidophosphoribosyltransferase